MYAHVESVRGVIAVVTLFLKQGLSLREKDFLSNFGAVCVFFLLKKKCAGYFIDRLSCL